LNKKEIDGVEYELKDEDKISTTLSLTDLHPRRPQNGLKSRLLL